MQSSSVVYKDFWFKIIGCLLASYLVDALNREETIFQRVSSKYFYIDIAGGFIIAFILWHMVSVTIKYLDKKVSWEEQPMKRILLQFALGVLMPALFSFLFTMIWMRLAYNQDIFKTTWLFNELYAVILIILLINLVYFTWWLYLSKPRPSANITVADPAINVNTAYKTIEVSKAGRTVLLPEADVAYAYLNDGYCYIKTFNEESFVTTYTLDELAKMLNTTHHFRVNRQILVSKKACKTFKSVDFGKIELELAPASKIPVIVSQKRARDFRKWITESVTA